MSRFAGSRALVAAGGRGLGLAVGLALGLSALAGAAEDPPLAARGRAGRDVVLLRFECASDLGRRETTLFANGTVRLRDGLKEDERMTLGELGPTELQGFVNRLEAEDLSEIDPPRSGLGGDWVERCVLELHLPDRPEQRYVFGRYDSLPLNLSRVVAIARELGDHADPRAGEEHLPAGYEPRRGDVLRRADGALFEIISFTVDDKGVELRGKTVPLTVYLLHDELSREFVALVSRRSEW